MAGKGLILKTGGDGDAARYTALRFVVGIGENQVNRLDAKLIRDANDYFPILFNHEQWPRAPRCGRSPWPGVWRHVPAVMDNERAECWPAREKSV